MILQGYQDLLQIQRKAMSFYLQIQEKVAAAAESIGRGKKSFDYRRLWYQVKNN